MEGRNFDIRKHLLEYDDVADQRQVVYQQRNFLLEDEDISDHYQCSRGCNQPGRRLYSAQSLEEQWDVPGLEKALAADFALQLPLGEWLERMTVWMKNIAPAGCRACPDGL